MVWHEKEKDVKGGYNIWICISIWFFVYKVSCSERAWLYDISMAGVENSNVVRFPPFHVSRVWLVSHFDPADWSCWAINMSKFLHTQNPNGVISSSVTGTWQNKQKQDVFSQIIVFTNKRPAHSSGQLHSWTHTHIHVHLLIHWLWGDFIAVTFSTGGMHMPCLYQTLASIRQRANAHCHHWGINTEDWNKTGHGHKESNRESKARSLEKSLWYDYNPDSNVPVVVISSEHY